MIDTATWIRLSAWLESHPGARYIVTSRERELCARKLEGLGRDAGRYVSRVVAHYLVESEAVNEMIDEMLAWERNAWAYVDDEFS